MESAGKYVRCIVLALAVLTVFFSASPTAKAAQLDDLKSQRESLQKNVDDIQAKIDEYQKNLSTKRGEITSLKNEITRINGEISRLNLEIKKTENQIYITRINIQETQANIVETAQNIDEKKETIASLLRELNKMENEGILERLLSYENISDALSQIQYIDSVQQKLSMVVGQTKILKASLEDKEENLKVNKKTLEQKNAQLAVQKTVQQSQKGQKDTLLKVTKGEEAKYQQLLTQAEQEQADFLKELAKVESQILADKNFISYFQAGTIPKAGTKLFVWPEDNTRITQGFGMTRYAKRGAYGGKGHNGVDMAAGIGSPVKSAANGKVVAKSVDVCYDFAKPSCNGYWGNWVAVQHSGGLITLYAHITKPSIKGLGESVESGDIIGYEGSTGNSTGAHLHFSVFTEFFTYKDPKTGDIRISYNYEKTLNPLDYL